MSERWVRVGGATLHEQAAHVAGRLAEASRADLVWRTPDGFERHLAARETDLPGLLLSQPGILSCPSLGLKVKRDGERLAWSGGDECARLLGQAPGG